MDQLTYLTVSPHGFTEYFNGLPAAFVPLERWLDERQLYKSVRELRFFLEFSKRKSFALWRDAWSHERMSKASVALEDRLFLLHGDFRSLLLSVRAACLELAETRLVHIDNSKPKTLKDFNLAQSSWRGVVGEKVGNLASRIHDEVISTFGVILDRVRRESRGPGAAVAALGTI